MNEYSNTNTIIISKSKIEYLILLKCYVFFIKKIILIIQYFLNKKILARPLEAIFLRSVFFQQKVNIVTTFAQITNNS